MQSWIVGLACALAVGGRACKGEHAVSTYRRELVIFRLGRGCSPNWAERLMPAIIAKCFDKCSCTMSMAPLLEWRNWALGQLQVALAGPEKLKAWAHAPLVYCRCRLRWPKGSGSRHGMFSFQLMFD